MPRHSSNAMLQLATALAARATVAPAAQQAADTAVVDFALAAVVLNQAEMPPLYSS